MKHDGLVTSYTTAQFSLQKDTSNELGIENVIDRQFNKQPYRNIVVSDLTYIRVDMSWNYTYVLVDPINREIIGYSAGRNKIADLVKQAFQSVKGNLKDIHIFHTDRGNEFKNQTINETLKTFGIKRALSHKGRPYDNAVAGATY